MGNKIIGVCIKSYEDEDDVDLFEKGLIEKEQIKVYEVGEELSINDGCYDKDYWKPKN